MQLSLSLVSLASPPPVQQLQELRSPTASSSSSSSSLRSPPSVLSSFSGLSSPQVPPCPRVHSSFDLHSTCWVTKLICQKATHSPTMKYVGICKKTVSGEAYTLVKGILHQKIFYRLNLIFWIVMGCGIARFSRRGLKTTET